MNVQSILLAEASPLFGSALTAALSRLGIAVTLYGQAGPVAGQSGQYDAVLVDVATFSGDAGELAELIQKLVRFAPVLLLAREDRIDQVITCFKAGATGLVSQTASQGNLRNAISAVSNGITWCDGKIFRSLVQHLLPASQYPEPSLTKREEEVLRCLALGRGNKEIAATLTLSQQSVKVYVSNLLRKLGVPNRGWLTMRAIARAPISSNYCAASGQAPIVTGEKSGVHREAETLISCAKPGLPVKYGERPTGKFPVNEKRGCHFRPNPDTAVRQP